MLRFQYLSQYVIVHGRGRIRYWQWNVPRTHFTTSSLVLHNSINEFTLHPQIPKPNDKFAAIVDIPPDIFPHPLQLMDTQRLQQFTKRTSISKWN